jgi:hypothetical protein
VSQCGQCCPNMRLELPPGQPEGASSVGQRDDSRLRDPLPKYLRCCSREQRSLRGCEHVSCPKPRQAGGPAGGYRNSGLSGADVWTGSAARGGAWLCLGLSGRRGVHRTEHARRAVRCKPCFSRLARRRAAPAESRGEAADTGLRTEGDWLDFAISAADPLSHSGHPRASKTARCRRSKPSSR